MNCDLDAGKTVCLGQPAELDAALVADAESRLQQARNRGGTPDWRQAPVDARLASIAGNGRILVQEAGTWIPNAWIVGDLHGDAVAAAAITAWLARNAGPHDLVAFLGDLIDDLPESHAVLSIVDRFRSERVGCTVVLRGNHDTAIGVGSDGLVRSSVSPSTLAQEINELNADECRDERPARIETVRRFASFIDAAPAALLLRDGTVLAHGGVPHVDLHASIRCRESLSDAAELGDFEWSRLIPRVRRRIPIPLTETRSRELGALDFLEFLEVASAAVGFRLERMVRGHCHHPARRELLDGPWQRRVLTINSMAWVLPRELEPDGPAIPAIAHWQPDGPCRAVPIAIDDSWNRAMRIIPGSFLR